MVTESISNNNSSQEGTVMGIDEITNSGKDYDTEFWNKAMRGKPADFEKLKGGRTATDMFTLPYESNRKYMAELEKESIFRQFATSINVSSSNNTVLAYASDPAAPTAAYVAEKLGLPTNPYSSVDTLCNKDKFRQFLINNGFNAPVSEGYGIENNIKNKAAKTSINLKLNSKDETYKEMVDLLENINLEFSYDVNNKEELIRLKGGELAAIFGGVLSEIFELTEKIGYKFNHDIISNVLRRGLTAETKRIMEIKQCRNTTKS